MDNKIENLAAKIIWAIENPDKAKKTGELNKKRVEEIFSWNNSIKKTVEAFKILTARRQPAKKAL